MGARIFRQPRAHLLSSKSIGAQLDVLEMKLTAAPVVRRDIGDGFGEVPAMPVKVLSIVLPLAIRMLLRLAQDDGSILSRALAVVPGIFDSNLNHVRTIGHHSSLGDGEAALARLHLDAVIGNSQTHRESKGLRQPRGR